MEESCVQITINISSNEELLAANAKLCTRLDKQAHEIANLRKETAELRRETAELRKEVTEVKQQVQSLMQLVEKQRYMIFIKERQRISQLSNVPCALLCTQERNW